MDYEDNRTLDKPLASVPSWVPNIVGTWGGNSVKFSLKLPCAARSAMVRAMGDQIE